MHQTYVLVNECSSFFEPLATSHEPPVTRCVLEKLEKIKTQPRDLVGSDQNQNGSVSSGKNRLLSARHYTALLGERTSNVVGMDAMWCLA